MGVHTEFRPREDGTMLERPTFQDIYLRLAVMMSERSTCERMKVGAVITSLDFRYVFGVGYNGSAAGDKNGCDRHGDEAVGNCGCIHAEANAVVNCRAERDKPKVVFCSHLPCVGCAKLLINLGGVQRVIYRNDYRIKDSLDWFRRASIKAVHMPIHFLHQAHVAQIFTNDHFGYACGCQMKGAYLAEVCPQHRAEGHQIGERLGAKGDPACS